MLYPLSYEGSAWDIRGDEPWDRPGDTPLR
jgi:hypothetical protein